MISLFIYLMCLCVCVCVGNVLDLHLKIFMPASYCSFIHVRFQLGNLLTINPHFILEVVIFKLNIHA